MKYVANGPTFVIVYVIAMIPTYLLPYVGSYHGSLIATHGIAFVLRAATGQPGAHTKPQ